MSLLLQREQLALGNMFFAIRERNAVPHKCMFFLNIFWQKEVLIEHVFPYRVIYDCAPTMSKLRLGSSGDVTPTMSQTAGRFQSHAFPSTYAYCGRMSQTFICFPHLLHTLPKTYNLFSTLIQWDKSAVSGSDFIELDQLKMYQHLYVTCKLTNENKQK